MGISSKLNRRKFLSRTAATGLGLTILPALGGCNLRSPGEKKPENWGSVTFFADDPWWPQKPEDIVWSGGIPGVDIDAQGNIWFITRSLPLVHEYTPDGKFIKAFGTQGPVVTSVENGPVDLTFSMPDPGIHQIKVDHEGNVWVVTWRLGVVYKCSPEGKVLMVLGKYNERGTDETHFGDPNDVLVVPSGDIFVADGEVNFRIVHFDPQGKFIKAWGKEGKGPGEFVCPHAIVSDSKGLLYVADRGNTRIQIFDQNGKFIDQWPDIIVPFDLWIDSEDNVWACGYGPLRTKAEYANLPRSNDNLIVKFNPQGRVLLIWTFTQGDLPGEFGEIHGIAVDRNGNVYASEVGMNTRVQKFIRQS
ncbi:MAG: Virginiamycin B lyase [Bacteroidetes bacterium ADurb.Bin145]|jgi:streptogramin lyase|nr:MAG: Virginiamycin B lyase [Bacteroidetes bacterium ADurb.Bin145]